MNSNKRDFLQIPETVACGCGIFDKTDEEGFAHLFSKLEMDYHNICLRNSWKTQDKLSKQYPTGFLKKLLEIHLLIFYSEFPK